jgi:hypothetical protein
MLGHMALKAEQESVEIVTDMGTEVLTPPATLRQLRDASDCELWLHAERKGLQAILDAGNKLVKKKDVQGPIAPTVSTRKYKIDPATGRLAENNGRKSRHALDGAELERMLKKLGIERGTQQYAAVVSDMDLALFFADTAGRRRKLTKCDIGNAYPKATRRRPLGHMEVPRSLGPMYDEDGDELCIELWTPIWGEVEAGSEWHCELAQALRSFGWQPCEGVPAMWRYGDARLVTIVDDILISENGAYEVADRTLELLRGKFGEVTSERDPTAFAGRKVTHGADGSINLSMPLKIEDAVRRHIPELLNGKTPKQIGLLSGDALRRVADGMTLPAKDQRPARLNADQKTVQSIDGDLQFISKVTPAITLPLHRLACVASCPPPEALLVAKSVLAIAYKHRNVGITYGGGGMADVPRLTGTLYADGFDMDDGAPRSLEATADAAFGEHCVYGLLLTYMGASVHHETKKLSAAMCTSTHKGELKPTSKAAERVEMARLTLRALGVPPQGPTFIGTDNKANMLVANDSTSSKNSRHFLAKYAAIRELMATEEIQVGHVADRQNPSDFLTKWVPAAKLRASLRFATGSVT